MKKLLIASLLLFAAAVISADTASAQYPSNAGFLPFGYYQPFGAHYGSSIRKPPYFATNPPVYYGARHARPYGLSPFAAPPQVTAGSDYRSRLRTQFLQPVVPTPQPQSNPCITHDCAGEPIKEAAKVVAVGPIRTNPFAGNSERMAMSNIH